MINEQYIGRLKGLRLELDLKIDTLDDDVKSLKKAARQNVVPEIIKKCNLAALKPKTAKSTIPPLATVSLVETKGLAIPPVLTELPPRKAAVPNWITVAEPPPAIIPKAHLRSGAISPVIPTIMTEPATAAAGVATVSSKLSNQGI